MSSVCSWFPLASVGTSNEVRPAWPTGKGRRRHPTARFAEAHRNSFWRFPAISVDQEITRQLLDPGGEKARAASHGRPSFGSFQLPTTLTPNRQSWNSFKQVMRTLSARIGCVRATNFGKLSLSPIEKRNESPRKNSALSSSSLPDGNVI